MRIRWRGLELPMRVVCDQEVLTPAYGQFAAEPFERGFGTTIGNSLRRILLSSIEGSAIAWVKFKGVQHEFSTIPGVLEDVTEIVLNLKQITLRLHSEDPKVVKIDKHEPGPVTAGDIQTDANVEVVDPSQLIATMTEETDFVVEMEARRGRGYVTAEENAADQDLEIGVIPIDSLYSPVRRVRYRTEDTRVGQKTNYDRLIMEVWTNGVVEPEMAMVEAAKILRKHLNPFLHYFDIGDELPPQDAQQVPGIPALLDQQPGEDERLTRPVAELDLSVRASNCLEAENVQTIGDLVKMAEADLLKVKNFGRTSLREVEARLGEIGLSLNKE